MYNKNKRRTDRRLPRRTEKAKYEKPPSSSLKSIGGFSRESFPASPIFGLRLLGNDSFFVIITPADAGKTSQANCLSNLIWDHPRSCGKDCNSTGRAISQVGSPPLTRERQIAATSRPDVVGITPLTRERPTISSMYRI